MSSWRSKAKRATMAVATGGASEVKRLMDEKKDAANEAAKREQAMYNSALRENAFGDQSYTAAQQSIMNDLIAGNDPTVTTAEVDKKMEAVTPQINQNFSNNVWSTSRAKALTNATQNAQDSLIASKKASRQSALDALRQESANRANVKIGQAATVTPTATNADSILNTIGTVSGIANTGSKVASLFV